MSTANTKIIKFAYIWGVVIGAMVAVIKVTHKASLKLSKVTHIRGDLKMPPLKLLKLVKCMLVEFCRSVKPLPHVRVKGHLGDSSQLLSYYNL